MSYNTSSYLNNSCCSSPECPYHPRLCLLSSSLIEQPCHVLLLKDKFIGAVIVFPLKGRELWLELFSRHSLILQFRLNTTKSLQIKYSLARSFWYCFCERPWNVKHFNNFIHWTQIYIVIKNFVCNQNYIYISLDSLPNRCLDIFSQISGIFSSSMNPIKVALNKIRNLSRKVTGGKLEMSSNKVYLEN